MPVKQFRGDSWERAWLMTQANGAPVDLTGAAVRLFVRNARGDLALSATTGNGLIWLDAEAGRIDLAVPYAATENLAPGTYRFDVEVTLANGTRRTLEQDQLLVLEDVTHD